MHLKLAVLYGGVLITEFFCLFYGSELPGDRLIIVALIGIFETIGVSVSGKLTFISDYLVMTVGTIVMLICGLIIEKGLDGIWIYIVVSI